MLVAVASPGLWEEGGEDADVMEPELAASFDESRAIAPQLFDRLITPETLAQLRIAALQGSTECGYRVAADIE